MPFPVEIPKVMPKISNVVVVTPSLVDCFRPPLTVSSSPKVNSLFMSLSCFVGGDHPLMPGRRGDMKSRSVPVHGRSDLRHNPKVTTAQIVKGPRGDGKGQYPSLRVPSEREDHTPCKAATGECELKTGIEPTSVRFRV